jgi:hypothetical protein
VPAEETRKILPKIASLAVLRLVQLSNTGNPPLRWPTDTPLDLLDAVLCVSDILQTHTGKQMKWLRRLWRNIKRLFIDPHPNEQDGYNDN